LVQLQAVRDLATAFTWFSQTVLLPGKQLLRGLNQVRLLITQMPWKLRFGLPAVKMPQSAARLKPIDG
jgi:hypothetical protein